MKKVRKKQTEVADALTDKQKLFADYYVGVASLNATRAARLAGYSGDENSLGAAGSRLLRNVKVRAYIDAQLEALSLSKNEVLSILTTQAKASLADVLNEDGKFDLADAKRRGVDGLLKKLKVTQKYDPVMKTTEYKYEYEIHDKQAAAVHLGKTYQLFGDNKLEITGKDGKAIEHKFVVEVVNDSTSGKRNKG